MGLNMAYYLGVFGDGLGVLYFDLGDLGLSARRMAFEIDRASSEDQGDQDGKGNL